MRHWQFKQSNFLPYSKNVGDIRAGPRQREMVKQSLLNPSFIVQVEHPNVELQLMLIQKLAKGLHTKVKLSKNTSSAKRNSQSILGYCYNYSQPGGK